MITPLVVAYREWFASAVRAVGLSPVKMLALTIPERLGERTRYWNAGFEPGRIPMAENDGVDVVFDADQIHWMLLIDLRLLQRHLTTDQLERLRDAAACHFLAASLRDANGLARWLDGVLKSTQRHPQSLQYPEPVRAFEAELAYRLTLLIDSDMPPTPRSRTSMKHRGLQRAIELLRSDDVGTITVRDLCESAHVSRRTLEYAFRQNLGVSPLHYLRMRRLHAVRCKYTGHLQVG